MLVRVYILSEWGYDSMLFRLLRCLLGLYCLYHMNKAPKTDTTIAFRQAKFT